MLKIKFAKAQTLFHSKLAKMSRKKRKNILGRVMEKSKNRIKDQVKKRREASEVSMLFATFISVVQQAVNPTGSRTVARGTKQTENWKATLLSFTCTDQRLMPLNKSTMEAARAWFFHATQSPEVGSLF